MLSKADSFRAFAFLQVLFLFRRNADDVLLTSRSWLAQSTNSIFIMKINIFQITISNSERLCTECKEANRKPVYVRGHFRVVKGIKVYVRAHYRNK